LPDGVAEEQLLLTAYEPHVKIRIVKNHFCIIDNKKRICSWKVLNFKKSLYWEAA
jgi:hypothetical protein